MLEATGEHIVIYIMCSYMGAWVYWRTWYSYILCTGVCTRVLEGTGEHTVINIFWLGVHVWWSVLENIQIYIYHVQCTCVFTGALEGTEEHTVIYILYMCMYRGVRGYWRTYSYIYYVHVYIQGCWRVLENIQCSRFSNSTGILHWSFSR